MKIPQEFDISRRALVFGAPVGLGLAALPQSLLAASRTDFRAFASWATAPVPSAPSEANRVSNQTIRQVMYVSLGGESVRVKLSNRYGSSPLVVQAASLSISNGNENIIASSARQLSFSGRSSFTIPAYGELYSDWLPFGLPPLTEVAVDIYISADTSATASPLTLHTVRPTGEIVTYLAGGNLVGLNPFPTQASRAAWYFISGIDVSSSKVPGAVVCFGDSITDGFTSTLYANQRYPDFLARRIFYSSAIDPIGVVNLGISGNRVLNGGAGDPALARFDRDVLSQSGVSHVIVLEGINDISGGNTAPRIIEGHRQMIERARAKRLKIYGGTLTPFGNAPAAREAERVAVNQWIRSSGAYDAVIDFDLAVRDPGNPRVMQARYDSGDSLHPNSVGYSAMADAINLNLFRGSKLVRT